MDKLIVSLPIGASPELLIDETFKALFNKGQKESALNFWRDSYAIPYSFTAAKELGQKYNVCYLPYIPEKR